MGEAFFGSLRDLWESNIPNVFSDSSVVSLLSRIFTNFIHGIIRQCWIWTEWNRSLSPFLRGSFGLVAPERFSWHLDSPGSVQPKRDFHSTRDEEPRRDAVACPTLIEHCILYIKDLSPHPHGGCKSCRLKTYQKTLAAIFTLCASVYASVCELKWCYKLVVTSSNCPLFCT